MTGCAPHGRGCRAALVNVLVNVLVNMLISGPIAIPLRPGGPGGGSRLAAPGRLTRPRRSGPAARPAARTYRDRPQLSAQLARGNVPEPPLIGSFLCLRVPEGSHFHRTCVRAAGEAPSVACQNPATMKSDGV